MRGYLLILTSGWILALTVIAGVNWVVDPYRIFHKPWVGNNYYTSDRTMRDTAAGIINTEEFDSIILGTSMAENFSPQEAGKVFGSKFVNISLSGSGIPERSLVLDYALRQKKLSSVILSIDQGSLRAMVSESPIVPVAYLYDDNRLNDLLIYSTNLKPIRYIFCRNVLVTSETLCPNRKNDLEDLVEWHSSWEISRYFGGLNRWLEAGNDARIRDALKSISESIRRIESGKITPVDLVKAERVTAADARIFQHDVLELATQHPQTHFYLFFPPYSRLNFAILEQSDPQRFEEYIKLLRLVIDECARHSNVHVFGFETEDFLDDIANYKDTSHYHQRINSQMLHWMKNGEHELVPDNIEPYIQTITRLAADYPLKQVGDQIDAYLLKGH